MRSFIAAFYDRPSGSKCGTCALEATTSLSPLFIDAAERVVAANLFEPRLRV
jgi:hypothetical protein